MSFDNQLLFFDEQAISSSAASVGVVDLSVAGAIPPLLELEIDVVEGFDSAANNGTLTLAIQTDDNADFDSATTLLTSKSYAESELAEGAKLKIPLPRDGVERYLRIYCTVGGSGDFTAGMLTGGICVGG